MNKNAPISEFMTVAPHTIAAGQTLMFAMQRMKDLNVRHLPVFDDGELVGILTERDIHFLESFDHTSPKDITVEEACSDDPLCLSKDEPLVSVCETMLEKRIGSVLITEGDKLLGIFTYVDALKILATK